MSSPSVEERTAPDLKELTRAFELFTKKTANLERAYSALKKRFDSVNLELEKTNSELKQNVQQLDRTTAYLNSILSHMQQGLLFVGSDGNVTTCNPAVEHILGITAASFQKGPFWEVLDDSLFGFSMKEALATGSVPAQSTVTFGSGHDRHYLDITATFVSEQDANFHGIVLLVRDVSEIRLLQIVANRNDRMKELGEMAASVAHEIRNPLGGIKGFASLLVRDLQDNKESRQMAQYIVDGTQTLDRLVSNVLHYARPLTLQLHTQSVAPVLDKVSSLIQADSLLSQGVTINRDTNADIRAAIDAEVLQGAILNLAVNGIQAMPQGGTLTLSLDTDTDAAVIQISDTGSGIEKDHLEKIFSPFFTTKVNGNGFGLPEVYRVVQAHGGDITVESTVGNGTTFTVRLPVKGFHKE